MVSSRSQKARASSPPRTPGEPVKGLVQNATFRFEPALPALDRLESAVQLRELPKAPLPEQGWRSRWRRLWARGRAEAFSAEQRLRWRYYDAIDEVMSLVSPEPYEPRAKPRPFWSRREPRTSPGIRHPYELKSAFELLAELPESFAAERRYLDELLAMILWEYRTEISKRTIGALSFIHEAQEYFISGYKLEKAMGNVSDAASLIPACQLVHDSYHHAIYYYMCALLSRERLPENCNAFKYFCNALIFRSKVEWDGQLRQRPLARKIPSRSWVLFFALRDRTVLRQVKNDPAFAKLFKDLLFAFPGNADPLAGARQAAQSEGRAGASSGMRRGAAVAGPRLAQVRA